MIHLANVLVAAGPDLAEAIFARLADNGYKGGVAVSADEVLASAGSERPDVVLVGPGLADTAPLDLLRRLKACPPDEQAPVLFLADSRANEAEGLAAGADDSLQIDAGDDTLLARLRPLVRLATMHAEVYRRAAVAEQFGLAIGTSIPAPTLDGIRLLLAGPDVNDVELMLAELGDVTVCANPFEAEDQLTEHQFDAAILDPRSQAPDYLDLCAHIRNNPRLFNLPVVLLAEEDRPDTAEAHRRGATRVISRPADPVLLRAAVTALVRRQRLRWIIRTLLQSTLGEQTRDTLPAVYSRAFLQRYLDTVLHEAAARNRHLSVLFFYAPNVEGIHDQFGEDASQHLLLQLGQWISGLVRAEDMTARYGINEFCVVLPDTPLAEAQVVMHRISGVLAYTDFAVKEVYQPVKVWVQAGGAEARPDDDVASLVARARRNLG